MKFVTDISTFLNYNEMILKDLNIYIIRREIYHDNLS